MEFEVSSLPKDPETLRKVLIEILSALHERDEIIKSLRHQLAVIRRGRFGRKSEKMDASQLRLFAEQVAAALGEVERRSVPRGGQEAPSAGHGRSPLPEHLVKERREILPPAEALSCRGCGKPLARIGEEHTDQLEYVPSSFFLKRFVRFKYACRPCGGNVVVAPLPPQPIEKGVAGPGFLAQVLVSKYADHIPLHRQEGIYRRHHVHVTRQSMCDWVGKCADLLTPVYEAMKGDALKSKRLNGDDTPVRVREEGREGSTREGRLWAYVGDEDHPHTVYDYTQTRAREGPQRFLATFEGYLQADAYKGYDAIYATGKVVEVGCWAHARRYFFDAKETDPVRAETMLEYIRQLYEVEKRARQMENPAERLALRQVESVPILGTIRAWLEKHGSEVLPKSPIGGAITYARNQWEALNRYATDGILQIDNNAAERALRAVAVGRKNWMFFGHDHGGRWAAVMYTLIQTCRRHDIDPWAYLRDVLDRLPTHPASRVVELTPLAWKRARDAATAVAGAIVASA